MVQERTTMRREIRKRTTRRMTAKRTRNSKRTKVSSREIRFRWKRSFHLRLEKEREKIRGGEKKDQMYPTIMKI
jgi:hypothetical protein